MAEYRLSPKAQQDMDALFDNTVERWGIEQALRYTDMLELAFIKLAEIPHLGTACDLIRPGYRRRKAEHHMIYYRPTDYGIAIIRILHERMDAPRHM